MISILVVPPVSETPPVPRDPPVLIVPPVGLIGMQLCNDEDPIVIPNPIIARITSIY